MPASRVHGSHCRKHAVCNVKTVLYVLPDSWACLSLLLTMLALPCRRRETWDLRRCGLPGKAAFTLSRFSWALRQKSVDAREGSGKLLDRFTGSSDGGDGGQIYGCAPAVA